MMTSRLQQASPAAGATAPPASTVSNLSAAAAASQDAGSTTSQQDTVTTEPEMENRAGKSTSPYVRCHAESPVKWQLLDDEAVERARRENKLVFMNVGFKACHYCRLTTQDSFSNPSVATLLNTSFVPIIIDREERPDIDSIYMNYIQAVNGDGGWPLNVFLTPDLEPVFGGTYWPGPGAAVGSQDGDGEGGEEKLDFLTVLQKMRDVWADQETRCRKEAGEILLKLREFAAEGTLGARAIKTPGVGGGGVVGGSSAAAGFETATTPGTLTNPAADLDLDLDLDQLEEAYTHIAGTFDAVNGGFSGASPVPLPKFPTPAKLSFLLRLGSFPSAVADVVGEDEVRRAREMAVFTLRRIRDGGLRDHVGAGFARYSVTADWAVPHFEKMVADNALLLGVYLDAWLGGAKDGSKQPTADDEFADVVFELADYLTSPPVLDTETGCFATSEAADSYYRRGDRHMREGAYYTWTRREFDAVVGGEGAAVAAAHWNVQQHGNVPRAQDPQDEFINQNVLSVAADVGELSRQFGIPVEEVGRIVRAAKEKLRAHREGERVRPETDSKAVVAYNGMVISALARTGMAVRGVDGERAERYVRAAEAAAGFVRERLWDGEEKVLYRVWNNGTRSATRGFADDYAFLLEGVLDLAEATGREEELVAWADELQKIQLDLFYDPPDATPPTPLLHHSSSGAFYSTEESAPLTILRLKDGMDTAQPSTNAVSAYNLFRLAALLNDSAYAARARETVNAFEVEILQYPWLFVGLLGAVVTARLGTVCRIVVGEEEGKEEMERLAGLPRAEARAVLRLGAGGSEGGKSWMVKANPALGKLAEKAGVFRWREKEGDYNPVA